jgi:DNA-binding PadR family transcriptional regulator
MQAKRWIASEWKQSPTKRRARYYRLTAAGRKQLGVEESSFSTVVQAIGRVMRARET